MLERLASDSLTGMIGAFVVWTAYFGAIYAFLSVACVADLGDAAIRMALLIMTGATLALIAFFAWRALRVWRLEASGASSEPDPSRRHFMALATVMISGLAFVSTVWVALPILLLSPCV